MLAMHHLRRHVCAWCATPLRRKPKESRGRSGLRITGLPRPGAHRESERPAYGIPRRVRMATHDGMLYRHPRGVFGGGRADAWHLAAWARPSRRGGVSPTALRRSVGDRK